MEREAESFAKQKSKYPRRAKALQPSWDEFHNKSFTEFIQYALFDANENDANKDSEDENDDDNERNDQDAKCKEDNPRKLVWKHGIVKITLPEGWWNESGIDKDRTARGAAVSLVNHDTFLLPTQ